MDTYKGEEETNVLEEVDRYCSKESEREEEESYPRQTPTRTRASTSGTNSVCFTWVSQITVNKLKSISKQFHLLVPIMRPSPNDRLHYPSACMTAFSKVIMRGGA